jgi:hypothetical protein
MHVSRRRELAAGGSLAAGVLSAQARRPGAAFGTPVAAPAETRLLEPVPRFVPRRCGSGVGLAGPFRGPNPRPPGQCPAAAQTRSVGNSRLCRPFKRGERWGSNPRPPGPQPLERGTAQARRLEFIGLSAAGSRSVSLNLFPELFPKRLFVGQAASQWPSMARASSHLHRKLVAAPLSRRSRCKPPCLRGVRISSNSTVSTGSLVRSCLNTKRARCVMRAPQPRSSQTLKGLVRAL